MNSTYANRSDHHGYQGGLSDQAQNAEMPTWSGFESETFHHSGHEARPRKILINPNFKGPLMAENMGKVHIFCLMVDW